MRVASYPVLVIALITELEDTPPSTLTVSLERLTTAYDTPSTIFIARSIVETQPAQCMPFIFNSTKIALYIYKRLTASPADI